jgi:hypothetical protein
MAARTVLIRKIIRADGSETLIERLLAITELGEMLGSDDIDLEYLVDGQHVMLLDKLAKTKDLPLNCKATELYQNGYKKNLHSVFGDAIILPLADLDLQNDRK